MSTTKVEVAFDWRGSRDYRAKKGMGKKRQEIFAECRLADSGVTHWVILNSGNDNVEPS